MKCTWVDGKTRCPLPAVSPQKAKDGEIWANLCSTHNKELDASIGDLGAPAILRAWVRAGGGAKKMAARMMK